MLFFSKLRFFNSIILISGVNIFHIPSAGHLLSGWHSGTFCLPVYAVLLVFVLISILPFVIYRYLKIGFSRRQELLEQMINKKTEDMMLEKGKTDALLENVLPKVTADEIKLTGRAAKVKYNFVTVLFSDIQGFTQIAEEMNPEVLIDELDRFFFHFDSVVEKYGIEKIKTIGDAYMCAGGLPQKNRTNPVEVILAALEMQEYMKKLKEQSELQGMKYWDIRIGIHTGTVVAGVVGQKKLSYDIWGDTVNTASRMESSGEAGKVNISGTTYEFVKDFFVCQHRGRMPVKYKGELDMHFVKEIIPELRDDKGFPNDHFLFRMHLMKLEDVEEAVFKIFSDEASPNLYFHNLTMTKNIVSQVELLANSERVSEELYFVLKLASLFIFTGYITDYEKPVEAALSTMDEVLSRFSFKENFVDESKKLIKNSFTENYNSLSDRILHDARLDYLGRSDYIRLTDRLLKERTEHGLSIKKEDWIDMQRKLLSGHDFLTGTGRILRSVKVEEQISALEIYYR